MVIDYAEQILSAVDIVVQSALKDIKRDQSASCIIIDDSDRKNGRYVVQEGSVKYDAYCAEDKYRNNDLVRVSIPNGDYTQKKYIEGKFLGEDTSTPPLTYVSPLDTVLDLSDNMLSTNGEVFGLKANASEPDNEICIWSANLNNSEYSDYQNTQVYDTISIFADFQTLLSDFNIISGSYGLRLRVVVKPTADNTKPIDYSFELDSSEMYGNPYSFLVFSTQEATAKVKGLGIIDAVSLYFYQKQDFLYKTQNGKIEKLPVLEYNNLLLRNAYLSFGSDMQGIGDNTLQIYTNDSSLYNEENSSATDDTKSIGLLWYNKDDNGKYIGFSDGLFGDAETYDYDELAYLQDYEQESRLLNQEGKEVPTDKAGLTLSADLDDMNRIITDLRAAIGVDLWNTLQQYQKEIEGILSATYEGENTLRSLFDELLSVNSSTGILVGVAKGLEVNGETLNTYYKEVLKRAKKYQTDSTVPSKDGLVPFDPAHIIDDPNSNVKDIPLLIEKTNNLMSKTQTVITDRYSSFMSVWDNYYARVTKRIQAINDLVDEYNVTYIAKNDMPNHKTMIENYFWDTYKFVKYKKTDYSQYDNKYCIYWYRYEKNYFNKDERFMEKGWRRLSEPEYKNLGLPTESITIDGVKYLDKKPKTGEGILTRLMDSTVAEERYTAILFYNHQMYKVQTEPSYIGFINANPPKDETVVETHGSLSIEHSTQSQSSYQIYGVNNCLLNAADANRTRYVKATFAEADGGDAALEDGQIFWYVPKNATMLTYSLDDMTGNKQFHNDIASEQAGEHSMEGYICFYHKLARETALAESLLFPYRIKNYYNATATQNTLKCKVINKSGASFTASLVFTFSSFGTSGTDYTLVVAPAGSKTYISKDTNEVLDLDMSLYDYNNKELPIYSEMQFTSEGEIAYIPDGDIPWDGENAYGASYVLSEDGKTVNGLKITTSNMAGLAPSEFCYYNVLKPSVSFTIPQTIEDGKCIKCGKAQDECVCVPRLVKLTTIYPISYCVDDYYIEGPSIVIYDSSGSNPTYYKNPFKLFYNDADRKDRLVENVKWSIIYYDENGKYKTETELKASNDYKLLLNYMPKLKDDNSLVPAQMYLDQNETSTSRLYPVVICKDVSNVILWAQPIYLMQNRYASGMLNDWDGSLEIDEENGTIMSTMVGAGRKTTNNTFEGVLMGNVERASEDNATGIGLYGFHDGAQSFHFGVDGTAFIGKSGHGRIRFDGNHGSIYSDQFDSNESPAGMKIDLDDAWIELRGQKNEDGKQAKIKLNSSIKKNDDGSNLPYFEVVSELGNHLIHIGDTHYIKTDVFEPTNFIFRDDQNNVQGQGMKIDLTGNQINASNFTLSSNNIYLNSTEVTDTDKNIVRYLVIKDNKTDEKDQKILVYVGSDGFYLKSATYREITTDQVGAGMKLDLTNGKIDAYNFALTSDKVILTTTGSTLQPYLLVKGNNGKAIINIDNTNQYIQSSNYSTTAGEEAGMLIDLSGGSITGYDFDLQAGRSGTGYIKISSSASNHPIWVGTNEDDAKFKVDWAGNLYASGATISGAIYASKGSFTGTISAKEGDIGGWTINEDSLTGGNVTLNSGGSITIKDTSTFHVTNEGKLTCTSATIGGWEVSPASGADGFRCGNLVMSPTGGLDFNKLFTVDENGKTIIQDLEVVNSLKVLSSKNATSPVMSVDSSGNIKIAGNGRVYFNSSNGANTNNCIYYDGTQVRVCSDKWVLLDGNNVGIAGNYIGIGPSGATLTAQSGLSSGSLRVGGDILYAGDIYCTNTEQKGQNIEITVTSGGLFGGKKQYLKFEKGILIGVNKEGSSTDDSNFSIPSPVGQSGKFLSSDGTKIVWKSMSVSSGTFKLGNNSSYKISPSISGDTATFSMTIPGQSYSGGTVSGHWVKVYANQALPSGYSIGGYEDKGSGWVQVGSVWADGGSVDGGTTESRTATLSVQFGAK